MQSSSDDGRVIGGALSFGLDAESVVWFDGEPVMLRDYLRSHGVPDAFEGSVLARGTSSAVVGRRADPGRLRRGHPHVPGLPGRAAAHGFEMTFICTLLCILPIPVLAQPHASDLSSDPALVRTGPIA